MSNKITVTAPPTNHFYPIKLVPNNIYLQHSFNILKLPPKMAGLKAATIALTMLLLLMAVSISRQVVEATHHHVVGDDKGWDTSTDLASWASTRLFKVGDNIWFDTSASQEGLVELESVEEFSSCDLSNPLKMYTEDINEVSLDGEGSRYFVSGNPESCKKGLKLHINVHPHKEEETNGDDEDDNPMYTDVTNPRGRYDPDVPDPDPSPKPKPKPPHIAPPPEEYDPDFDPYSPPEPYYPPPTPSGSTSLNVGRLFAMVAAAFWVAI